MANRYPENPNPHQVYESAINRLIPQAERTCNQEMAQREANGRAFNWDRRFHEEMNRLSRQAGLREL